MMDATRIHSFNSFVRMMYAYSTPEIARHDGWLKIGDTKQGVDERIGQQTHTADVLYELQWRDIAMYRDDNADGTTTTTTYCSNGGTLRCIAMTAPSSALR